MIIVLKLTTGEEVIGYVAKGPFSLTDPMYIVAGPSGAMRLRDAVILSEEKTLTFPPECVITTYKPIETLIRYYIKALEYSKYASVFISSQIEEATQDMDTMIRQEKQILDNVLNQSGSKLN